MLKRAIVVGCSLLFAAAPRLSAQERGAAALGELVQSLGTTTRVLMIGAHPDDEDTQLIAYLAKARHIETAYLSLTRGDGGQNLIGNELGPVLGMIRTEELLAARRIDGGRQYFTRAFDFGFSKNIDETYEHWPKDSILKDMVEIVRAFRPQVIVSVWSGTPQDGHGHHQYSGVLAREVFDAAADSVRFPASAVHGLKPWTPAKFYRSNRRGGGGVMFNVGEYDPLTGRTYSELATESRSQHRSQGQGQLPQRGPRLDAVKLEASRVSNPSDAERGLFDGMDSSWTRFKTLRLADSVRTAIDSLPAAQAAVTRSLDLLDPSKTVPSLVTYVRLASRAANGVTCETLEALNSEMQTCDAAMGDLSLALSSTRRRAIEALLSAAAVTVEATAPRELIAERDTMPVTLSVYNQGKTTVSIESVSLTDQLSVASKQARPIRPDSLGRQTLRYRAADMPTLPWWLRRRAPAGSDMFNQSSAEMVIGDDRLQSSGVEAVLRIDGIAVPVRTGPIVYRFGDRARGEVRRPISTIPEISVLLQHEVEYARANAPFDRMMLVAVHSAATTPREVDVSLALPPGLKADSAKRHLTIPAFGDASVYFRVQGRLAAGRQKITATATSHGENFTLGFVPIEYEHIRPQRYYRESSVQLEAVSATFANLRIGYIRGVGDNVMPMLEELGLPVVELDPATLPQLKLSAFTTIVIGSRAYEANSAALLSNTPLLMKFARDGGTVITQYGQNMSAPGILPFSVSREVDRVTDEHAAVRVLDPGSPLLSAPNKIGDADFANWVQERASYMPHTFDAQYRTVFSMNDKDEAPNDAALLVAPLGKGAYIYTTLSFFRQLPAGNPGAARLFINLLSAGQRAANRPLTPKAGPVRP
ncbi:MAG: LmbE family protein [Gemmatimonadetes bacterium]|nr:LmbE family protein [Gemmatimonadota bacterium]